MTCATHFRSLFAFSLFLLLLSLAFPIARAQEPAVRSDPYKKWIDEDVRWIITDQERAEFKSLSADKQRDEFVVAFWERRNPVPGAAENAFKQEHYRRLAYANQHFAAGVPGWKTDRGRFYIMYGPPDKVQKSDFDSEEWYWEYIAGIGRDVTLRFVDKCRCGEYHLTDGENGPGKR